MTTRHEQLQTGKRIDWTVSECVDCGEALPKPVDNRLSQWHKLCQDCRDLREDARAMFGFGS